jgi:superfamily I DNA/RNA helicase
LLAEVCGSAEGLFFVADSKQSIYSRSYRWGSAHPRLQFRGRTAALKRNYRSTKEIEQAAFSVLVPEDEETLEPSNSIHDGPLPVLVRGACAEQEADWIWRFVREMARHLHLRQSAAAVLVPSSEIGRTLATQLANAGIPAIFFAGRELDLTADCVKVLTLYSAKGLEFPIVVVAGLYEGTYPLEQDFDDADLFGERMRHERRLLYVALTRAMRGLMLLVPKDCKHRALQEIDLSRWHLEEAG